MGAPEVRPMRCPMCHVILSGPRQYFHHRCGKRKVWRDEGEARKAIKSRGDRNPISVVVAAACEHYGYGEPQTVDEELDFDRASYDSEKMFGINRKLIVWARTSML